MTFDFHKRILFLKIIIYLKIIICYFLKLFLIIISKNIIKYTHIFIFIFLFIRNKLTWLTRRSDQSHIKWKPCPGNWMANPSSTAKTQISYYFYIIENDPCIEILWLHFTFLCKAGTRPLFLGFKIYCNFHCLVLPFILLNY